MFEVDFDVRLSVAAVAGGGGPDRWVDCTTLSSSDVDNSLSAGTGVTLTVRGPSGLARFIFLSREKTISILKYGSALLLPWKSYKLCN